MKPAITKTEPFQATMRTIAWLGALAAAAVLTALVVGLLFGS
jgi:Mg/Co/Ni transporter MgtE